MDCLNAKFLTSLATRGECEDRYILPNIRNVDLDNVSTTIVFFMFATLIHVFC